MKRNGFVSLLLLAVSVFAFAQETPPDKDVPDKAKREIERRGYLVQKVTDEIANSPADAISEIEASVPEDDSGKFVLTIIYGPYKNAQTDKLKEDLLAASGKTDGLGARLQVKDRAKGSYDVYSTPDSQMLCNFEPHKQPLKPDRFKGIEVKDYPTIIIQPPRDESWGPASTVINQRTGYDGKPDELALWIMKSLRKYALAYQANPQFQAMRRQAKSQYVDAGHRQDIGGPKAPFDVMPKSLPIGADPKTPWPDLVPTGEQALTIDQIKAVVPDAPAEFIMNQLMAKVTSPSNVQVAWLMKQLQDQKKPDPVAPVKPTVVETEKVVEKPVVKEVNIPTPFAPAWLTGLMSSTAVLTLISIGLHLFGAYAKTTPSLVDDKIAEIVSNVFDRKLAVAKPAAIVVDPLPKA